MRRILRYSLVLALLGGLIWLGATLKLGHRTAFGHIGAWSMKVRFVRDAVGWTKHKLNKAFAEDEAPRPKAAPRPAPPAPSNEPAATPRRVALLERADEAARAENPPASFSRAQPPDRTRVDERLSTHNKKALDALVSSRANRH